MATKVESKPEEPETMSDTELAEEPNGDTPAGDESGHDVAEPLDGYALLVA
ncbi:MULTISPECIES: hypothetical protein [Streptomyces]|uniref:hypothetical protein n=1 Tax=Streptomyces TaxID=1883 RepID=UPI00226DC7AF|nr:MULTISPECIES: hypothetical protein [unclassified Streptomyces]MCY0923295.1 hypothetical protein [Streptomyces sp. H27-G5]MCY0943962.1 hypothetical protein [Streptomyces sp. H34-AA3]MCY0956318.1 hypothetical protein [Streptomyces sp. H27-H5]MCZ4082338.1 hypothetical protein [Streptomyces sp. H34-S5]